MDSESVQKQKTKWIRLLPAVAIIVFGGLFLYYVTDRQSITGRSSVDMLLAMAIINFGFYIAIRVLSKLPLKSQLLILGPFIAIQMAALACLKFDGLYGDGRPVLGLRFGGNESATAATDDFQKTTPGPSAVSIELTGIGFGDWPTFRGPNRDGILSKSLSDWGVDPPREIWRVPVGEGWSAFVTCGLWCFTQEQRGEFEAVACREIKTGAEVWVHLDLASFVEPSGGNGPRATPTIADDGKLYSLGATGILNCLDATTGDSNWSVNILDDNEAENLLFGMGASPLVYDNLVIVCAGGESGSLVAYNRKTGGKVWAHGDARASYSSPQIANVCGHLQVLVFNAVGVDSHDPLSGKLLWHIPFKNQSLDGTSVCQPIVFKGDRVFISSGYEGGCAVYQIRLSEDGYVATKVWANKFLKSKFADAVKLDQFVYGLDNGILVCIDADSGNRKWKRGRYGHGQMLLVGSQLLIQAEKGNLAVVNADPTSFKEVSSHRALSRRTWTHPVIAGQYLLIRNDREAVCYEIELVD